MRIVLEAVALVPEYHLSSMLFHQVQTAVEGAYPNAFLAVLEGVIHSVATQRLAVGAAVLVACKSQSLGRQFIHSGLDQSGTLGREPQVAFIVFHDMVNHAHLFLFKQVFQLHGL